MLLRWTGWGAVDASDTAQALAEHFDFDFAVVVNFLLERQLQRLEYGGSAQQQQQQHEEDEDEGEKQ